MKQYITKKQWSEITEKQQWYWLVKFKIVDNIVEQQVFSMKYPNIGQMIEFLKEEKNDDFIDKYFDNQIHIGFDGKPNGCNSKIAIGWDDKEELCDALWLAVKNKLNRLNELSNRTE